MKSLPKQSVVIAAMLSAAGLAGLMLAYAQETAIPVQLAQPDSTISIAADEQGLQLVSPDQVPRFATFWWVLPGSFAVPMPFLPQDSSGAIYQIADGQYLVDDTGGQVILTSRPTGQLSARLTGVAALAAQADGLVNLITQVQTAQINQQMQAMGMSANVKPMGGDFSPDYSTQNGPWPYLTIAPTGTNQLLITVINTNPANYELWWTPVLANPAYPWTAVAVGATGQTNFTVNIGPYSTGFYEAIWDTNAIPLWEAADPNNPGAGILAVFIDSPTNGMVLQ